MVNHEFFMSWKLWQQMTFVLACGIIVTVFIGFIKVAFDRNKLRKYAKADKGKQTQTPEMLEAQPVTAVSVETKDEIPFGIRAIQSGIEVDGVWISRTNTPVGSSRASISDEKASRSYNNSQLDVSKTGFNASSRTSSQAPSLFDRAVSTERIPNGSRSSSPGRRHTYIKCTNCNHNVAQPSSALESPQSRISSGPPSPQEPTHIASGSHSNKSSRRTSDESDYMNMQPDVQPYETAYIRPKDPRSDLQLLQSHRMSHVAETGQLTPRVRRPGNSGADWPSVPDSQISTLNGVSYFVPQKTPSPPLQAAIEQQANTGAASSPQPTEDEPSAHRAREPMRLSESYAPKAAYYPDTYQPRFPQHQYSYDEVPYEVFTEQNHRDDQVLRKVNPGFEILKPGTFQPPTPEELELAAEKRQSKKLQKKRRASDDSRQSAFVEQV